MVRILLVDEQKVIREGLKVLLESESDLEIVAAVSNGYVAISRIDETLPDILFISTKLSEVEGLDVIAIIRKKYPLVKIVIFSDLAGEQHLIQSLEMGVRGYLLKDTPMEEIIEAIYAVDKGYTHIANGAYDTVVPQMSRTLSESNAPKPEIVFSDTAEYNELPEGEITRANSHLNPRESPENYEVNDPQLKTKVFQTQLSPLVTEATRVETSSNPNNFSLFPEHSDRRKNRYFSIISWASLGLLAASIGVISVISARSSQLVIENAIINGTTVTVNSPISGKVTKINYAKGASVSVDSVIATVTPLLSDRYTQQTTRLEEQLKLKQQQQIVANQSLAFLETSLQNIERELVNGDPVQLNSLLKSIHRNQLKYQEIALQTAIIREDAAKTNYQNLAQLQQQNRVSLAQLNLAKNSWELAKLAIEEITTKIEGTRQEYELIEQQIAGNRQQQDLQDSQKIARLQQQIESQKTSLNLLQEEINSLDNKLVLAIAEAAQQQDIELKSPITGTIYDRNYSEGEIVDLDEPILTLIDCNDLWIEATVRSQDIAKINTQKPVSITLIDSNLSLEGKISTIEAIEPERKTDSSLIPQTAIQTEIPSHLTEANYSKAIVKIPDVANSLNEEQFCSVGQTARLSFGEGKEPVVSQKKSNWFSKIIASPSES